jgi:PncC family amidohydrolase
MNLTSQDFEKKIADQIGKILSDRQQTIAVAESVTAGHLQTSLSLAEKALHFFQGGITAYNIGQKTRHLGIDPIHAVANNCVSEKIAIAMAQNVTSYFSSDWGIGITGYASPVPEKNIEELFSCFAICFRNNIITSRTITAKKDSPLAVRLYYNKQVLQELLKQLETGP